MPKKSNTKQQSQQRIGRIATAHGGATKNDGGGSDDDLPNDNMSVISNVSSGSYMRDDGVGITSGEDTAEELSQDAIYEEKLKEAMDLASQKSASGRVNALDAISRAFVKKYIPDFVDDRRVTLTDIVERSIEKGKGSEITSACNLAVLLCLQLDGVDTIQEVYGDLKSLLITVLHDASASPGARASVALALATVCFLASEEGELETIMAALEKIFLSNPIVPQISAVTAEQSALTTAAVSSWSLLLTELPNATSYAYLVNHLNKFEALLDSPDVDLRIAAGEAVIVLFENAFEHDEEGATIKIESIVPKLQELAKDSHKYRSKKDRKEQKSNFRDYVKTVEDGETYSEKFVINKREILEIESWSQKKQYDCLCRVLGSGMNLHLSENVMLRDIFDLGDPIPALSEMHSSRPSKQERLIANQMASKVRTQARGRHRDKRSAVVV